MATQTKKIAAKDVRTPTHRDLKALKAIIQEGSDAAKKALMEATKDAASSEMVAGVTVFNVVLDQFDDVMYWLGDLAGFEEIRDEETNEVIGHQLDDQPYYVHQQILDVLIDRDDLPGFFGWYMRTMRRFSGLLSNDSASGSVTPIK